MCNSGSDMFVWRTAVMCCNIVFLVCARPQFVAGDSKDETPSPLNLIKIDATLCVEKRFSDLNLTIGSCLPPYAWGFAVVLRHTTQRPWDLLLLPWKTTTNTTPIRPPPPPPPTRTAAHDTTILPTMTTPIRHRRLPQRLPQRLTPRSTKNPSMTF